MHFTRGNIKAAAEFGIVRSKVSGYIGSKDKGAMGSNATEDMSHPIIVKSVKIIQKYRIYSSTMQNETDVLILDDKVYGTKVDNHMVKYKEVRAKKISWVELNVDIYNVCLQHSPLDMESLLKAKIG